MKNRTYNPYPKLGQQFKDGLDYIKDNLLTPAPPEVTLEEINDSVAEYLQTIFGDEENGDEFNILSSLISSLIPASANSYQNNQLFNESFFSETQVILITTIMNAIKSNSVEGINSVLEDAEEEISKSGLSASEQAPLFMAVTYAKASNAYWTEVISTPGNWESFINSNAAINHANLPFWTLATFESALSGFAQVQQLDTPSANLVNTAGRTIAILAALTSTLGVTAGKVLLKFVQRPVNIQAQLISRLNGGVEDLVMLSGAHTVATTKTTGFADMIMRSGAHTVATTKTTGFADMIMRSGAHTVATTKTTGY